MTLNVKIRPGTVVVGYDGSDHAKLALRWAADEAASEGRPLTILHVTDDLTTFDVGSFATSWALPGDIREAVVQHAEEMLSEARDSAQSAHSSVKIETGVATGDPRSVLLEASKTASCLFVGSRGRGPLTSLLLGSVSVAVSRAAHCPIFVVRPHHEGRVRNGVIVGTDCTEESSGTLEFAYRQASIRQLPLTVLHCVNGVEALTGSGVYVDADSRNYEQERLALAESVAGLAEKFPDVRAELRVARGAPDALLLSESDAMNLIVVGHHGNSGLGDMLGFGSFATPVVENARCAVAVFAERHHSAR